MATEYKILRSKMLDYLKNRQIEAFDLYGVIRPYFRNQTIELDDNDLRTVEQIFHEFYLEGILIPGRKPKADMQSQSGTLIFPFYHLTEYGEKVISTTEYQPHDPDSYLARIGDDIPGIDGVIIRYLEECLSCFRRNLLLAAAVMLGCAAEKAVLLLVQAYGDSLSGEEKEAYEKETGSRIISRKWKALWQRLEPSSKSLPGPLSDDLPTILERVFDIIRVTRNEAGHPQARILEKETVHANLLLFPIFAKRVYGLIQHFSPKSSPFPAAGRSGERR